MIITTANITNSLSTAFNDTGSIIVLVIGVLIVALTALMCLLYAIDELRYRVLMADVEEVEAKHRRLMNNKGYGPLG